jgi:hypothetical protein
MLVGLPASPYCTPAVGHRLVAVVYDHNPWVDSLVGSWVDPWIGGWAGRE